MLSHNGREMQIGDMGERERERERERENRENHSASRIRGNGT